MNTEILSPVLAIFLFQIYSTTLQFTQEFFLNAILKLVESWNENE